MKLRMMLVALVFACAGCASNSDSHINFAAMREAEITNGGPARSAYVWRHRLAPNQKFMARFPTLATVQGEGDEQRYHDFNVIFGLPAGLEPMRHGEQQGTEEAEVRFKNPDPAWEMINGYGLMWGWWPVGYSPFVRIGAEGRMAVLVFVESTTKHRIVQLAEGKVTVSLREEIGQGSKDIIKPGWAIDATSVDGVVTLTNAYEVPADDPILEMIEKLEAIKRFAEP